jgi:hypothetical protein
MLMWSLFQLLRCFHSGFGSAAAGLDPLATVRQWLRIAGLLGACSLWLAQGLPLHANGSVNPCTEVEFDAALVGGGRITFACDGTIPLRSTKIIAVDTILDASDRQVILSGSQSNRLFIINPGVTLTLRGLTLTAGKHQGAPGRTSTSGDHGGSGTAGQGGAILNAGGTLIAINTRFTTNNATGGNGGDGSAGSFLGVNGRNGGAGGHAVGGAIDNDGGILLLTNCTFVANSVTAGQGGDGGSGSSGVLNGDGGNGGDAGFAFGGAIANRNGGLLHLINCSFSGNSSAGQAAGEAGFAGGGITFDGRDGRAGAAYGGALFLQSSQNIIFNSTFDLNRAQGADGLDALGGRRAEPGNQGGAGAVARGGAIAIVAGSLGITNSTFHANRLMGGDGGEGGQGGVQGFGGNGGDGGDGGSAAGGGVAVLEGAVVVIINCTLANNTVSGGQGGIGGNPGTEVARHGRTGSTGPALGANVVGDGGAVELGNVLLAHGDGAGNSAGAVLDLGHNLSSDSTPSFNHPASRNEVDPLLGSIAQHGGPTRTIALLAGSPGIDSASEVLAPILDQRGFVRVGPPDIGAYEWGGASPGLSIALSTGAIILSWPLALADYHLQSSPSLLFPTWENTPPPEVIDVNYVITLPIDAHLRFYRLTR